MPERSLSRKDTMYTTYSGKSANGCRASAQLGNGGQYVVSNAEDTLRIRIEGAPLEVQSLFVFLFIIGGVCIAAMGVVQLASGGSVGVGLALIVFGIVWIAALSAVMVATCRNTSIEWILSKDGSARYTRSNCFLPTHRWHHFDKAHNFKIATEKIATDSGALEVVSIQFKDSNGDAHLLDPKYRMADRAASIEIAMDEICLFLGTDKLAQSQIKKQAKRGTGKASSITSSKLNTEPVDEFDGCVDVTVAES